MDKEDAAPAKPLAGLFQRERKPSDPSQFGRIFRPDEAWLAKAAPEPILEPDLAIVDTHHHLWDMPGYRYLLPDLLADLGSGHKVIATVFNECHAMYRANGPVEMRPVGEVEFCAGVAAMSDSGQYGPTRICAGIVGHADLALGDRVAPVLEAEIAAGGGRFRGVRHGAAWDDDPVIGNSPVAGRPGSLRTAGIPRRHGPAGGARPVVRCLDFLSADRRGDRPGAGLSAGQHHPLSHGRAAGLRPLCRPAERSLRGLEGGDDGTRHLSQRVGEAGRPHHAAGRLRLHEDAGAALVGRARGRIGGPTPRPASSCSAPSAAWSKATSRSRRWASAMPDCGTR